MVWRVECRRPVMGAMEESHLQVMKMWMSILAGDEPRLGMSSRHVVVFELDNAVGWKFRPGS